MFKNKYIIIILLSLLVLLLLLAGYFALNKTTNNINPIDTIQDTVKEENTLNIVSHNTVTYHLLLDKYKEFSHQDIINNFQNNRNEKYITYIQNDDNKSLYMELLFGFKQNEVYQNKEKYLDEISPLLQKSIDDLTLEEKLKIDAYYARIDNGAMDVFKFNNFIFSKEALNIIEKEKTEKEVNKILKNKNISYLDSHLSTIDKEVLLYYLVKDYYIEGMNNKFVLLNQEEVSKLINNKGNISCNELAYIFYTNYRNFKESFSEVSLYKNKDAFVSQEIMDKAFELNFNELKDEFNKFKESNYNYGTYESFIISEYVGYTIFNSTQEDVSKINQTLSTKKIKDMSTVEYFQYVISDAYLAYINENNTSEIEHHQIEYEMRYGEEGNNIIEEAHTHQH